MAFHSPHHGLRWRAVRTGMILFVICIGFWTLSLNASVNRLYSTEEEIGVQKTVFNKKPDVTVRAQSLIQNLIIRIHNTTVVTAYFDIGVFPKGSFSTKYSSETYTKWAARFKYVLNPVVLYTDSKTFAQFFNSTRSVFGLRTITKIVLMDKNSSWAFQRVEKVAKIFKNPNYPKHLPNTVVPEYACAQFAKYDVISRAAKENTFKTKYYMWLDVGYLRDRLNSTKFIFVPPKDFNESKLALNEVYWKRPLTASPANIFKSNIVWLGGGLIFGERNLVIKYEEQFMRAVDYFISLGLINTDQQVTYAMLTNEGKKAIKPEIDIQVYKSKHQYDWFYLGYSMLREVDSP